MGDIIAIGGLKLDFLHSKETTNGSLDMFLMTVQPNARMPIPHYHESWDEAVYGMSGALLFTVGGEEISLGRGDTLFIQRGVIHGFRNETEAPATCLCTLTPGALGTGYFREVAALAVSGPPDPTRMKEVMLRYGLVPVPLKA